MSEKISLAQAAAVIGCTRTGVRWLVDHGRLAAWWSPSGPGQPRVLLVDAEEVRRIAATPRVGPGRPRIGQRTAR